MANFFENLAGNFAGVVQYNKDNSPHATITIDDVCFTLTLIPIKSILRMFKLPRSAMSC